MVNRLKDRGPRHCITLYRASVSQSMENMDAVETRSEQISYLSEKFKRLGEHLGKDDTLGIGGNGEIPSLEGDIASRKRDDSEEPGYVIQGNAVVGDENFLRICGSGVVAKPTVHPKERSGDFPEVAVGNVDGGKCKVGRIWGSEQNIDFGLFGLIFEGIASSAEGHD